MTNIDAVIERVRGFLGALHGNDWVIMARSDRDALLAHIDTLKAGRDKAINDALDAVAKGLEAIAERNEALVEVGSWRRKLAENARLRAAASDATAHLAAAVSLLEHGGKKAAPSDKMFAQMLVDYNKSLSRARSALNEQDATP